MKILLVHLDAPGGGDLAETLRDFGHDVHVVAKASAPAPGVEGFRPDVIVVRLESESASALDVVDRLAGHRAVAGAHILFTGTNEVALSAARRRFPDASFARLDTVETALASIEADE